jgi:hypothetical protein
MKIANLKDPNIRSAQAFVRVFKPEYQPSGNSCTVREGEPGKRNYWVIVYLFPWREGVLEDTKSTRAVASAPVGHRHPSLLAD